MENTQPDQNRGPWFARLLEPTMLVEEYPNSLDENTEEVSDLAITQFVFPHPEARPHRNEPYIIALDDTELRTLPERSTVPLNQAAVLATGVGENTHWHSGLNPLPPNSVPLVKIRYPPLKTHSKLKQTN
jgi:hypothetical protein